mgnify:CR=1 FL=1
MIKILIVLVVFGCTVLSIKSILNKNKKAAKNLKKIRFLACFIKNCHSFSKYLFFFSKVLFSA